MCRGGEMNKKTARRVRRQYRKALRRHGKRAWHYGQSYTLYLESKQWAERRALAIHAANGKCQSCGGRNSLNVHHRNYKRLGKERPTDLIVLCRDCHDILHGSGLPLNAEVYEIQAAMRERQRQSPQSRQKALVLT